VYRGVGGASGSSAGGSEACVTGGVGAKRGQAGWLACEQRGAAKTAACTTKDYRIDWHEREMDGRIEQSRLKVPDGS